MTAGQQVGELKRDSLINASVVLQELFAYSNERYLKIYP